jgi:hypothetical protein
MKEEELCGSMRSCRWNHFGTAFGASGGSVGASRARSGATTGRRRSVLFRRRKQQRGQQEASDADDN